LVVSQSTDAAPKMCGDRDQILKRLEQTRDRTRQSFGPFGDSWALETG
jgi:hypothetical protein